VTTLHQATRAGFSHRLLIFSKGAGTVRGLALDLGEGCPGLGEGCPIGVGDGASLVECGATLGQGLFIGRTKLVVRLLVGFRPVGYRFVKGGDIFGLRLRVGGSKFGVSVEWDCDHDSRGLATRRGYVNRRGRLFHRKTQAATIMPRDSSLTLSDVRLPTLAIVCEPCGRRGRYNVEPLIAEHGDAKMTDLLQTLAACPKVGSQRSRPVQGGVWAAAPVDDYPRGGLRTDVLSREVGS